MKIAIVGTGAMAAALGAGWVAAGHEVTVAGRSGVRTTAVATAIGARTTSMEQVSAYADVVLLAVHHRGIDETLSRTDVASLAGRILVDCMNAVETDGFTLELPPGAASISEYLAGLERSAYLEAAAALVITLLGNGEPSGSMLTWRRPTEAVVTA